MTTEQLVETFNPANAPNLTQEQIQYMRGLTDEQIRILSERYPNTPSGGAYLILYDSNKPITQQFFSPSTWGNLFRARVKIGLKNLSPYTFRVLFVPEKHKPKPGTNGKIQVAKPIDLSTSELSELPGINTDEIVEKPPYEEKLQQKRTYRKKQPKQE